MNKRVIAAALFVLYFTLAIAAGALHHNHVGGAACAHEDCAACVLHINCVTDVPVTPAVVAYTSVEFRAFHVELIPPFVSFSPTYASRAPPHPSA
jgi:hypothetical protein